MPPALITNRSESNNSSAKLRKAAGRPQRRYNGHNRPLSLPVCVPGIRLSYGCPVVAPGDDPLAESNREGGPREDSTMTRQEERVRAKAEGKKFRIERDRNTRWIQLRDKLSHLQSKGAPQEQVQAARDEKQGFEMETAELKGDVDDEADKELASLEEAAEENKRQGEYVAPVTKIGNSRWEAMVCEDHDLTREPLEKTTNLGQPPASGTLYLSVDDGTARVSILTDVPGVGEIPLAETDVEHEDYFVLNPGLIVRNLIVRAEPLTEDGLISAVWYFTPQR